VTSISRQNTLFVAEDWRRIYEALSNIDFTAYDQDSLRNAVMQYIRETYPDEFNDWIGSSEFIIKLDILTYFAQSLSYRIDLNTRENFLSTAERRDSLLRLAYNVAYRVNRAQAATGELKLQSIRTTQRLNDLDDNPISGNIQWNDPNDPDWFEKWLIIMNSAFASRTKWGTPLRRYKATGTDISLYRFNSPSPATGVYNFKATTTAGSLPFEIVNVLLNESTGVYEELAPNRLNSFHLLYRSDGKGVASSDTGFFLPFRQGQMAFQDATFTETVPMRSVDINVSSVNDTDVYVTRIDENGDVLEEWEQVQSVVNESLAYRPSVSNSKVFEVVTRNNDQITVKFGDGKFGAIPKGIFRFWYRTSSPIAPTVRASDIRNKSITIPYVSDSEIYNLTLTFSLTNNVSNAARAETNEDIRTRANKVFYSQNRMVTGEDYNSYLYSDASILKAKVVNRTFSGHGKSIPLRDPSGTYNNVNAFGTDGRIYKESTSASIRAVYDSTTESIGSFISDHISPLIKKEDKQILYYDDFPKYQIPAATFTVTSTANNRSLGKLDVAITTGDLDKIIPNSILFFKTGETSRVDYVVSGSDGTTNDSILLKRKMDFVSSELQYVMPPMKRSFTEAERTKISEKLLLRRSFGIRWDADNATWETIANEDLNAAGDFSLEYQGNQSAATLDASWLIKLEYAVGSTGNDEWTITDRGISINFESEKEVEFIHVNDSTIVDDKTGKKLRDGVVLLETNETRDSLPRRGQKTSVGSDPIAGKILIQGDGTTRKFDLSVDRVEDDTLFFLVNNVPTNRSDWKIERGAGKTTLVFDTAPPDGQFITVIFDPRKTYATPLRLNKTGDGSTTYYSFSKNNIAADNTFAFKATKLLRPFDDYTVYEASEASRIKFQTTPGDGQAIGINYLDGGAPCFASFNFTGDGSTTSYPLYMSSGFVMVFVNGDRELDYTLETGVEDSYVVTFDTAPAVDSDIHIRALLFDDIFKIDEVQYTASNGDVRFEPPSGVTNASTLRTMVWVNGAYQHSFTYDDGVDDVVLSAPLAGGEKVIITNFTVTGCLSIGYDYTVRSAYNIPARYLPTPKTYLVHDRLRHSDGYSNIRGIRLTNIDEDLNGEIDDPFGFRDFIIDDGENDLVLWRKVTENGFDIWEPISELSVPRGTYHSPNHIYNAGDSVDSDTSVGDIHYDQPNDQWLIAGASTWATVADAAQYKKANGRGKLQFRWQHYTSEERRIDPAASNVIDAYVLTKSFDDSMRTWVAEGGTQPSQPTSDSIRTQYQSFENFKMVSDAIVWHPARYKLLFGSQATDELRAKFLVVKTPGTTIPDNDLKIRVLQAIDEYFDINLWDFGEKFYYTELCSYIHSKLATVIQSVVPVSISGQAFGKLFQIRAEPDELFLSSATADQIEIVDSFTDNRLNIKS
jgi:ribosomal protein L27